MRKLPVDIVPVSIARFSPKWYQGFRFESLAPPKKLLWKAKQGKISEEEYTIQYLAVIEEQYTPESLLKRLYKDFGDKDIVLLCFEKKREFCHRRLLSEWLEAGLGIEVKEL